MDKHVRVVLLSAAVAISPAVAFAQREPDQPRDSLGALAAFRDPRAASVRADGESSCGSGKKFKRCHGAGM